MATKYEIARAAMKKFDETVAGLDMTSPEVGAAREEMEAACKPCEDAFTEITDQWADGLITGVEAFEKIGAAFLSA